MHSSQPIIHITNADAYLKLGTPDRLLGTQDNTAAPELSSLHSLIPWLTL